jgi:hypothetical protein
LIHIALMDWQHLAPTLRVKPMPIAALGPQAPHYVGAVDASRRGIGGFWLPTRFTDDAAPLVF